MPDELLTEVEEESSVVEVVPSSDGSTEPTEENALTEQDKIDILNALLDRLEQESETETIEETTVDSEEDTSSDSEYTRLIYEFLTAEEEESTTEEEIYTIMDKPLKDYTVIESLLCFIGIALLVGGIVYVIKKGLPGWR